MKSLDIKKQINTESEKIKNFFAEIGNPDPDRDWFAVISILVIIFIIISIWSIALYFLYFPSTPALPELNISSGSVDEKKLSSVLNLYEERKKRMDELEKNPPIFKDPSI